ncbi:MAG: hypothetical protein BWY59_01140 [Verrucomicrobia bacterium ADurb.Bin345]|nr:MAG: hypothetical protein BWY59_01140 [Verrucomicrobia bacterium ADurb.Bin345]
MRKESRAENAIRRVSELNELVYALREAGRKGREERAAKRRKVRKSRVAYAGEKKDAS